MMANHPQPCRDQYPDVEVFDRVPHCQQKVWHSSLLSIFVFLFCLEIVIPVLLLRYEPLRGDTTLLQQLRHARTGGMTGSVIVQAEVHLPELGELPQHLQHWMEDVPQQAT